MDLIIKARNVTVTLTVQGFLKVVSANENEIRFYISGEDNIREASEQLSDTISGITHTLITWVYPLQRGV